MAYEELLLSNQLCFLVYRLDREINARYRPLLAELGLTYPQYLVMLVLWEEDNLSISAVSELREKARPIPAKLGSCVSLTLEEYQEFKTTLENMLTKMDQQKEA